MNKKTKVIWSLVAIFAILLLVIVAIFSMDVRKKPSPDEEIQEEDLEEKFVKGYKKLLGASSFVADHTHLEIRNSDTDHYYYAHYYESNNEQILYNKADVNAQLLINGAYSYATTDKNGENEGGSYTGGVYKKGDILYVKEYEGTVREDASEENFDQTAALIYAGFNYVTVRDLLEVLWEKDLITEKNGYETKIVYITEDVSEFEKMVDSHYSEADEATYFSGTVKLGINNEGCLSYFMWEYVTESESMEKLYSHEWKFDHIGRSFELKTPDWVKEHIFQSGLVEIAPLDLIKLEFSGFNGYGTARIVNEMPEELAQYFSASIDPDTAYLSNGGAVSIFIKYDKEQLENLGYKVVGQDIYVHTVTGLITDRYGHMSNDSATAAAAPPENGIITTADELHAVLLNGDPAKSWRVTAKELDMTDKKWSGMENFSGTFDFGGCVITNASYPLFRSVKGGTVKNLTVDNSIYCYGKSYSNNDINAKTGKKGNTYYSPIVCYATDITVENVRLGKNVNILAEFDKENVCVGGIVACAEGDSVSVKNCSFSGVLSVNSETALVGGIAGNICSSNNQCFADEDFTSSRVLVYGCENYGAVGLTGFKAFAYTSGIVGNMQNGAVIRCGNYSRVEGRGRANGAAGILGNSEERIAVVDCINSGTVYSSSFDSAGIVSKSNGIDRWIVNCINLGAISSGAINRAVGIVNSYSLIGQEKMINCYNYISICGVMCIYRNPSGLTSAMYKPEESTTYGYFTVENCHALSKVSEIFEKMEQTNPGVFELKGEKIVLK